MANQWLATEYLAIHHLAIISHGRKPNRGALVPALDSLAAKISMPAVRPLDRHFDLNVFSYDSGLVNRYICPVHSDKNHSQLAAVNLTHLTQIVAVGP
jgi:hypothetical protein